MFVIGVPYESPRWLPHSFHFIYSRISAAGINKIIAEVQEWHIALFMKNILKKIGWLPFLAVPFQERILGGFGAIRMAPNTLRIRSWKGTAKSCNNFGGNAFPQKTSIFPPPRRKDQKLANRRDPTAVKNPFREPSGPTFLAGAPSSGWGRTFWIILERPMAKSFTQ